MSRCFPFPPPGYIRKAGTESADNVESLKQDKHREKDKKEKKDRDKREGKDRKERDRSDEKHRDNKERKDKHRDKKKDKDKDRDKERKKEKEKEKEREKDHSSSSNDRRLPLQIGLVNGDNSSKEKGPVPVSPGGQTGDKSNRKERDRDKHRNSTPDGKKSSLQHVRKTITTNDNSLRDADDNNKYVQELQKRVSNDRNSGTQLAEKFMVAEKKTDAVVQVLTKPTAGTRPEGKDLSKEKRDNERKVERVNGTLKVQNIAGVVQSRAQEVSRLVEQNAEGDRERRKKLKGSESEDKRGDKSKDKDGEKKGQGEVKELGKDMDEERIREKTERNRHIDQERVMLSRKNGLLSSPNSRSVQQPVKEPDKTVATLGNVAKKRKDHDTNGFLHANKIRSNKMPKQSLASNPPLENGRLSDHHQSPGQVPPSLSVAANNSNILEANKEEKKINGVTDTHVTRPVSPSNTLLSISQVNPLLSEVPLVRSPHPDSIHLNEILSRVPRMEELPELDDDQGWLFDTDCEGSKKSKRGHTVVNEIPQVWGESLHIESADIYALPYVIPY